MRNFVFLFSSFLVIFLFLDQLSCSYGFQLPKTSVSPPTKFETVTIALLNNICSKTDDFSFCLRTLSNHTHIAKTDIGQLTQIVMGLANKTATDVFNQIKSSGLSATDEGFMVCYETYSHVIQDLWEAFGKLGFRDMRVLVFVAAEEAKICGNQLKQAPSEFSKLRERNRNFLNLCRIIRIASESMVPSNFN